MTRKDFVLIADAIKECTRGEKAESQWDAGYDAAAYSIASSVALALASTNDRFDRERFLKACGVQQ